MKNDKQMAAAAAAFAARWEDKGYERGESQLFWADLLTSVFGVENLPDFLRYEEQVASMVDSTNFIDVHIPSTKVLIEQKSINIDLRKPVKRGDGYITPFLQAKLYIVNMPQSEHPKWVVTCNFPWPTPTDEQKAKIEQTAQAILDARALSPDSSLADLYDEVAMPIELRKAHQNNDRAVMQAYGFPVKSTFTESQCVAELFKMYQELTKVHKGDGSFCVLKKGSNN